MRKPSLTRRDFLGGVSAGLAMSNSVSRALPARGNPNALALKGGTPVRVQPFPAWPQTETTDEDNLLKSLRNHRWCTFDGEFIPKFEKVWAEKTGSRGCVMTPCGTHALHMALELLGVGPGDEVIVSPYTYIATIDAILLCYALPVFADSDLETFQLDPDDVERRISEHTRAILPVHIYGAPANLDRILAIARKHRLPVIEDACQSHLVEWRGKKVGTLGAAGCFSFQESKILPGGEAGALVSDDEDLISKAYSFRDFGSDLKSGGYTLRGTKYRISDFAAAVLMAQVTRFEDIAARREQNAAYLRESLTRIPGLVPQKHYPESTRQNYYCFGVRYDPAHFNGLARSKFIQAMRAEGIPISAGYPPLNKEPYLEANLASRGFRRVFGEARLERYRDENRCPQNDELCASSLVLPHECLIGRQSDVEDILEASIKIQKNSSALAPG